jgi:trehalose 6-phosphate phosphatase
MRPRMSRNFVRACRLGDSAVRESESKKKEQVLRPETKSQLTLFLQTLAQAPEAVLLLDYDGTLAPFRVARDQAYPYPGVAPLLQEIVRNGRTRVVVISGRDATDVLPLLNIHPPPEVWGIHGLQRLKTDGSTEMPRLDERTLTGLSDAGRWLGYQQLRHTAEFKAGSVAVHWRGLSENRAENLRSRVLLGWRPIAEYSGLNVLEFDGGVEIRACEADKGNAVRTFLSEISPDAPVAYLGDDSTDESAFRAMQGRGVSVLVRPKWRQTVAQFWLKPPDELVAFLGRWLKACVEQDASNGSAAAAVSR